MNIGLTGGIACGKSTVAAMLVRRGALLVDADQIAREVVLPGSPALAEIAARFGQDMLQEDGSLHRKRLGEVVFADPQAKKDLESILHPRIRSIMKVRMQANETLHPDKLCVVDVPLLYESRLEYLFTEVMVVYVPEEIQLMRLMERDHLTREQAENRLKAQLPIDEKKARADIVIDNRGTLEETERQVETFLRGKGLV
jgi:dephospho-CoA kinase